MRINRSSRVVILLLTVIITGCAQVPRESVEISDALSRDLEEMHLAHRALADLYYDEKLAAIDQIVDQKFTPYIIQPLAEVFEKRIPEVASDNPEILLPYLQASIQKVVSEIEAERLRTKIPIQKQKSEFISSLDQSYGQLLRAQLTLSSLLKSIADIHEEQSKALSTVGLEDVRIKMAEVTSSLSDKIEELNDYGSDTEIKIEDVKKKIDSFKEEIEEYTNSLRDR